MKKKLLLLILFFAIRAYGYLIDGYVYWGTMGNTVVKNGPVFLYTDTTSSPIDTFCITPNGYYSFTVPSGVYWVKGIGLDPTGSTMWWKRSVYYRIEVIDTDKYQIIRVETRVDDPRICGP